MTEVVLNQEPKEERKVYIGNIIKIGDDYYILSQYEKEDNMLPILVSIDHGNRWNDDDGIKMHIVFGDGSYLYESELQKLIGIDFKYSPYEYQIIVPTKITIEGE